MAIVDDTATLSRLIRNYRGQNMDYVNSNVSEGEIREKTLCDYLENKGVHLVKKSKYKYYDFVLNQNHNIKIEFKSINYSVNTYKNVFIGFDKLLYYFYRQYKNENLIFILIYGFYEKADDDTAKITYRYDIIDVKKYLLEYSRKILLNKKHINIPVITLKPIKGLIQILKNILPDTDLKNILFI